MYCPVCRHSNGDFAVRCQNCGTVLPAPTRQSPPPFSSQWTSLTTLFAAAAATALLCSLALVGLISQRGLWPALLGDSASPTAVVALTQITGRITPSPEINLPRPGPMTMLGVGEIGSSDGWRFVIEQVTFVPDATANGWQQAIVTYTIQNASRVSAHLDIPSTVVSSARASHIFSARPSVVPLPVLSDTSPDAADSLRLYLLDRDRRPFGGGFGASTGGYEVIAAPGDAVRLSYRFRYPSSSTGPFVLRLMFPGSAGETFDVRLDRSASQPAKLAPTPDPPPAPEQSWLNVTDAWAVTCEGVEFGPAAAEGERRVTVHLAVRNLGTAALPALTDPADSTGTLRDFYLTDRDGNLAYSHSDTQPGVLVPPGETRHVMVQLFTQSLSSASRPMIFTAVLNWRTNHFVRFEVD